ncbi:hypothetical protein C1645_781435 [Glomus cerebriforme]|uniref:Uncharacterized protein n=1 Tax=Glomus cerebriforme TaxID=658196 RepID=A0A397SJ39_9GLOM|nr:hypothetical protein C1645_781435 [Glomus cerebriforme]
MSKAQNLLPPPSLLDKDLTPNDSVTSLPPLPDDFLSFQPQPSYTRNSNDDITDTSLDNIQQQEYRGRGTYYNKGRGYYNNNKNNNYNNNSYNQKRGYYSGKGNNFGGGGGGGKYYNYGTSASGKGGQQQRYEWNNNYFSPKKRRFNENRQNNSDISSYCKKSFLEDPWADLIKSSQI